VRPDTPFNTLRVSGDTRATRPLVSWRSSCKMSVRRGIISPWLGGRYWTAGVSGDTRFDTLAERRGVSGDTRFDTPGVPGDTRAVTACRASACWWG
jgi:hypothetical protein